MTFGTLAVVCLVISMAGYANRGPKADWTLPQWPRYFLCLAAILAGLALLALVT